MLTQNQLIESQANAAIAQLPYGPTTCINSLQQTFQKILKIKAIYSLQTDEDGQKRMGLNQAGQEFPSNISIIKDSPFTNGRMGHNKMSPFLEASSCFFNQSGLLFIPPNQELNQDFILNSIQYFNNSLLTREYDQQLNHWNEQFNEGEQRYDQFMKDLKKPLKGCDMNEVICVYPLNQHLFSNVAFSSQSTFSESIDGEITRLICQSKENAVCGVLVKREITVNYQLICRYLVFTECQFINDPCSFTNLRFMEEVKRLVEPNSQNQVVLASTPLNGFLLSNRFIKKSSDYKEQMKRLKTYVVGTDKFIRVGGTHPTFKVLFSKFEVKQ
ncbi:hypothetical protein ACX0AN_000304 [Acinetobacter baumannii]|jgi:hypothetical protein|uniref:Uncharacterized protein n=1 Tax=Acinetobacter baumannii TaxID=470 RepID=A0A1E3MEK9_ACIBA|nr:MULTISPECIES: hypothetical protein [Acinetobacter]ABS90286.2 hypothetical protein A1S_3861 [Acinetobacter baumannii ATCC 17978]AKQ25672.1 hypothetical protein ACX60_02660 [Acinetobacter baumannii]APP29996.1 hypothetical protein AUO97_03840 [Acinetobacter baumannii]APX48465.1 hypothetical protein AT570_03840 [Acinetobacter baumannii]EHU1527584.1 hypothetical protein [Acinetobacter baumannii]